MTTQGIICFEVLTVMGYSISRGCTVHQGQRRQPPVPWCKQQNIPAAAWLGSLSFLTPHVVTATALGPQELTGAAAWLLLMPSAPKCFILCGKYSFPPEFWWCCRSEIKPIFPKHVGHPASPPRHNNLNSWFWFPLKSPTGSVKYKYETSILSIPVVPSKHDTAKSRFPMWQVSK